MLSHIQCTVTWHCGAVVKHWQLQGEGAGAGDRPPNSKKEKIRWIKIKKN